MTELLVAMAANRMQTRQSQRTVSRMQRDQGVITPDDFEAKRKQILGI